jgi:Zn ribbon nucleic-acid-binding protein
MDEMPYVDKKGRVYKYGDFFPMELSPFPYNDTLAQRFFPISFEQATQEHYNWKEQEKSNHTITKQPEELLDHIKDATQSILSEVIGCKTCGRGYRITSYELEFLKRMNLPLPRQCPFCRIKEKIDQWVKELRMIDRVCSKCGKQFQTHYSREDVEYILCKQCYQQEVA